ncbi:MAG: hypothetical protein KF716_18775 [Anaerolineae bacterium]|nr:hypothetical protein [Anaerolineae bacterium]
MNNRGYLIAVLVALLTVVAIHQTLVSRAADEVTCTINFEATVHTGTSTGLAMKGELVLSLDPTGSATGVLTQTDGTAIKAVGQVNGHAINLTLELGQDMYIFGVGTLTNSISECMGQVGGPFAGPKAGDLGDWGYAIGGRASK